jgi:transposase
MSVGVEALFTSALCLRPPWEVQDVKLDTAKQRIDFQIGCARPDLPGMRHDASTRA